MSHTPTPPPPFTLAADAPHAASLLLQLVQLRQEPDTRRARRWLQSVFRPIGIEQWQQANPPGSEGDRYLRMVLGHWQMVATLWKHGYLPGDLLFPTTSEFLDVWNLTSSLIHQMRASSPPHRRYLVELEEMCQAYTQWREGLLISL